MPANPTSSTNLSLLTPQESLALMQKAANEFYSSAVWTNCHAFVEFTGLINEFIKICTAYQESWPKEDFRQCNVHTGRQMVIETYQLIYILEKLKCIYQADFALKQKGLDVNSET